MTSADSVSTRKLLRLGQLHGLSTTLEGPLTGVGAQQLAAAHFTLIPLAHSYRFHDQYLSGRCHPMSGEHTLLLEIVDLVRRITENLAQHILRVLP
jgi:hypothetical protein